ncbi:MAG: hypothetical protein PHZ25_00730 [Candidatus Pacebacteria bacterium]|nr:hypothetical protein [Candidatus Paceibacterota bacterium]
MKNFERVQIDKKEKKEEEKIDIEEIRDEIRELVSRAKREFEDAAESGEEEKLKGEVRHLVEIDPDSVSEEELLLFKEVKENNEIDDAKYKEFGDRLNDIVLKSAPESEEKITSNAREFFKKETSSSLRSAISSLLMKKYAEFLRFKKEAA